MTFLGIVEHGAIKLPPGVELPEGTAVRVDVVGSNGSKESGSNDPIEHMTLLELARKAAELSARPECPASAPPDSSAEPEDEPEDGYALNRELLKFAGVVTDLPPDFAINHDHYLYGVPKRE